MNSIEENAINLYKKNINYLEENDKTLYERIKLFEEALNFNHLKERYSLEYKEDYFDVYDNEKNNWLYNTNSIIYSKNILSDLNFNTKKNTFKTFYDYKYEDEVIEKIKNVNIDSSAVLGISNIVHYINKNLPKKENFIKIYNYIVFGVGLGLHIPVIHKKLNAKIYNIIEPSLELFRLSLFVTDYTKLAQTSELIFYIANNESEFYEKFSLNYMETFFYNHYVKFFLFNKNCDLYINSIQNMLTSQGHYLYSYDRELMSLKRTFKYAKEKYKYIDISKIREVEELTSLPVLVLGAGPSLQNEIEFIKREKNNFYIIAVYGTMPFLEKNNIKPDAIVQYDEGDKGVYDTILEVKDLSFFKDTILLFSSHLDKKLYKSFHKKNIYIFQAMFKAKERLGSLTSPSVGEITFALSVLLGFRKIFLLGIDMSLDPETQKSHIDGYISNEATKDKQELSNEEFSFRKNIISIKGNFLNEVKTLPMYITSIRQLVSHINTFKKKVNLDVSNFSNGAFFEGTTPLKTKNFKPLKNISNKKDLDKNIKRYYDLLSTKEFNENDIQIIENKIIDAKKIRNKIVKLKKLKKIQEKEFKLKLHEIQENFCEGYVCYDLQKILNNYFNFVIHYIFYLLNLQEVSNKKEHIKNLQELLSNQLLRIVDDYIKSLKIIYIK